MHFKKPTRQNIKNGAKNLDLNKLMQNVGSEQFDYGTFKASYDEDPRVKAMVKNFDQIGIEPKTQQQLQAGDDPAGGSETGGDPVAQMAKSATDLGAKL